MSDTHASFPSAPDHLCTTFRLLRQHGACTSGYKKLAEHIRDQFAAMPEDFGMDRHIPIAVILETNGLEDALWSLRATIEPSSQFARLLACDFAEHVLPIFEAKRPGDNRPRRAIEVARLFEQGQADRDQLAQARRDAAYAVAAAYVAADVAADAAAYAAADAAAAAYAAADAAYAAADAAAAARLTEKQWQLTRFREVLNAAQSDAVTALEKVTAAGCVA